MSVKSYYRYCFFVPIIFSIATVVFINQDLGFFIANVFCLTPYIPMAIWMFTKTKKKRVEEIKHLYNRLPLYLAAIAMVLYPTTIVIGYIIDRGLNFESLVLIEVLQGFGKLCAATLIGLPIIGYAFVGIIKLSASILLNVGLLKNEKEGKLI